MPVEEEGLALKTAAMAVHSDQVPDTSKSLRMDMRATFEHIDHIDTVAQTFKAKVYIKIRVEKGFIDKNGPVDINRIREYYVPRVILNNMVEEHSDMSSVWEQSEMLESTHFEWSLIKIGTFSESMELRNFPLDTQCLAVQLQVNCSTKGANPAFITVDQKTFHPCRSDSSHQVRNLYDIEDRLTLVPALSDPSLSGVGKVFPLLSITAVVHRRPASYFYNVVLPMFFITAMISQTFMIPREEVADRLAFSVTLVLTAAAYKIVISQLLPAVPYLTLLDKYIGCCSLVLVAVALENGMVGKHGTDKADELFCIVLFSLVIIFHLYFIFCAMKLLSARKNARTMQRSKALGMDSE